MFLEMGPDKWQYHDFITKPVLLCPQVGDAHIPRNMGPVVILSTEHEVGKDIQKRQEVPVI